MKIQTSSLIHDIDRLPDHAVFGRVTAVQGLLVELDGMPGTLSIGDRCVILTRPGRQVVCEVIGFRDGKALMMPFGTLEGVALGCRAESDANDPNIYPTPDWLGRVINALGEPVDGKGPLGSGEDGFPIKSGPPAAHERSRVGGKIDLGVRAMNSFLTCCKGQRMGIFSGSGIGKSSLLSMMARHTQADVSVIGLIGERGREAREFIEDDLGEEGLARSVVVVATSDEPPLMRRQAAYMTMAVAEYFRNSGRDVLALMDSVTRFAMAQREIGLSVGEPPASKGYTPSVFAELPLLLERAGPGTAGQGSISGLFTVLVEGDDHNEPVADAVRGILDGHVVLDRAIAERGRFPPINILRSVSRTMPNCNTSLQNAMVARARKLLATYDDMAELIRLGAYRRGSDAAVDEAITYFEPLETFLAQDLEDKTSLDVGYDMLGQILGMPSKEEAPPAPKPEEQKTDAQEPEEQEADAQEPAEQEPDAAPPAPPLESD